MTNEIDFEDRLMNEYRKLASQIVDAQAVLKELTPRLDKVFETIKAYGLEDRLNELTEEDDIANGAPAARKKGQRIEYEVGQILTENQNRWMKISEIYPRLLERGISIGGKNPNSNLSAHLSNSEAFEGSRTKGWRLIAKYYDAEAAAKKPKARML